jgi:hypothetical protein
MWESKNIDTAEIRELSISNSQKQNSAIQQKAKGNVVVPGIQ